MIQMKLTAAAEAALLGGGRGTFLRFTAGSGGTADSTEIQTAEQSVAVSSCQVFERGQSYNLNGTLQTAGYSHVRVTAHLAGADAETDYDMNELALVAEDEGGNEYLFAYGSSYPKSYPVTVAGADGYSLVFDLPLTEGASFTAVTTPTGVTYRDLEEHASSSVANSTCHGLAMSGGDLTVGGVLLDVCKSQVVKSSLGIALIADSLPASAETSALHYSTGASGLYRWENNEWTRQPDFDSRLLAVEQTMSVAAAFPFRTSGATYAVGDVVLLPGSLKRLECVEGGTTASAPPASFPVGQLVQDGTCTWIVDEFGDAKVGTVSCDYIVRPGWIKASGATVNRADYPRLWAWVTANNLTGGGGLFGTGDGSTTFDLPDFTSRMIQLSMTSGTAVAAGLPNIYGEFYSADWAAMVNTHVSGAFTIKSTQSSNTPSVGSNTNQARGFRFNASVYNSIYGNSSTVQPPAITMLPVIKY